ncbi:kinase-like protein, partial [Punctularia strigosozonata HHB-11173 SS5]|uniref:kinase-like protein n=1 Tax=Punctularia strigosozonata (strain HHB-11173) TaxID=741275 RepID=UPI0004417AFB
YSRYILHEAEALAFVQQNTSIPLPRVLDSWEDDDKSQEKAYLLMEFVQGDTLRHAWPTMTQEARNYAIAQLRAYVAELRSLRQPGPPWIGSCSRGPGVDHRIQTTDGTFPCLPSVAAFHDFLLRRLCKRAPPERYQAHRCKYKDDYPIVFSHADFHPGNILVDPSTGKVNAIIDWEMAGWWPAYWEYRKALYGINVEDPEWLKIIPQIMDEYPDELAVD